MPSTGFKVFSLSLRLVAVEAAQYFNLSLVRGQALEAAQDFNLRLVRGQEFKRSLELMPPSHDPPGDPK